MNVKLYNKFGDQEHKERLDTLRQQHEDQIKSLREQHEEQIKMVENQRPQPIEFEQVPTDGGPLDLGNGIIAMPGDYYSKDPKFVVAKDDTAWVPAE
jgi:hypothetical protein